MFHNEQKHNFENSIKLVKEAKTKFLHLNYKALTFINPALVLHKFLKIILDFCYWEEKNHLVSKLSDT